MWTAWLLPQPLLGSMCGQLGVGAFETPFLQPQVPLPMQLGKVLLNGWMDAEYHQGKVQWALQAGSKAKQRLEQPIDLGWKKRERTRQSHCKLYYNTEVRTRNGLVW